MGEDQCGEPKGDGDEGEEAEKSHCEHRFGDDEVAVKEIEEFADPASLGCVEEQEDPHCEADPRRTDCDNERVEKRDPEMRGVEKKLIVPFESKALPVRGKSLRVKRED